MESLIESVRKFNNQLNEAFVVGDWIKQTLSDAEVWGVVIGIQKNGGLKVVTFTSFGGSIGGQAKVQSAKGWYPAPTAISKDDVPPKMLAKIMKKAGKYLV